MSSITNASDTDSTITSEVIINAPQTAGYYQLAAYIDPPILPLIAPPYPFSLVTDGPVATSIPKYFYLGAPQYIVVPGLGYTGATGPVNFGSLAPNTTYYLALWQTGISGPNELLSSGLDDPTFPQLVPGVTGSGTTTCYVKGSLILCVDNNNYIYKKIEDIRVGMDILTLNDGIKKVKYIGYNTMKNTGDDPLGRIYVLKKSVNNTLFEDLYVTGGHSILVDKLSEQEEVKNNKYWDTNKKIDDKIMLLACVSDDFKLVDENDNINLDSNVNANVNANINANGNYEIYHICLENSDADKQYGIYVNGILSETINENYILTQSGMKFKWTRVCYY